MPHRVQTSRTAITPFTTKSCVPKVSASPSTRFVIHSTGIGSPGSAGEEPTGGTGEQGHRGRRLFRGDDQRRRDPHHLLRQRSEQVDAVAVGAVALVAGE